MSARRKPDANQTAARLIRKGTGTSKNDAADGFADPELRRQFEEAKRKEAERRTGRA
jgi:hypothetical protein